jgi:hypothetical protein
MAALIVVALIMWLASALAGWPRVRERAAFPSPTGGARSMRGGGCFAPSPVFRPSNEGPPVPSNLLRKMSAEALYMQLGRLIEEMPDLKATGPVSHETLRWLGRANALVTAAEGYVAEIEFQQHRNTWEQLPYRQAGAERIMGALYRALGTVETELPGSFSGAFIPAGNVFDAMAAVGRIFASAKTKLLIVDPYLDEKMLTEFALLAPEGVALRLFVMRRVTRHRSYQHRRNGPNRTARRAPSKLRRLLRAPCTIAWWR